MRKYAGTIALLLLGCSVSIRAVNVPDSRILGKWKLQSERPLKGPAPALKLGTVMTMQLDKSGNLRILNEHGQALPNPPRGRPAIVQIVFSLDGRTMTEISPTGTSYVWQKQR
jgi:hypothetical protein